MSQKVWYKNCRSRMDIWKDINHYSRVKNKWDYKGLEIFITRY